MTIGISKIIQCLKQESLQKKQLYACSCLEQYCTAKHIMHPSINELYTHLKSMPDDEWLMTWSEVGTTLSLNGRGEAIPNDLAKILIQHDAHEFMQVVDSAVEVGIVDLFGAPSNLPLEFCEKILLILKKNEIPFPAIEGI